MRKVAGLGVWSFLTVAAAAAEHASGEHQILAAAITTFLTHVLAHLTSDQAKEALAGFKESANHDLEFALAAAYQAALDRARKEVVGGRVLNADFKTWFDQWDQVLAKVHNAGDASQLFYDREEIDPATKPDVWGDIRVLLLRWANHPSMPPELEAYLAANLPGLIETGLERVVREAQHSHGWIAWQESFWKATRHDLAEIKGDLKLILEEVRKLRKEPQPADIERYLTAKWNGTLHIEIKNLRTSELMIYTSDYTVPMRAIITA